MDEIIMLIGLVNMSNKWIDTSHVLAIPYLESLAFSTVISN